MQRSRMLVLAGAAVVIAIVAYAATRDSSPTPTADASPAPRPVGALTVRDTKSLQAQQAEWAARITRPSTPQAETPGVEPPALPAPAPTAPATANPTPTPGQSLEDRRAAKAAAAAQAAPVKVAPGVDPERAARVQRIVDKLARKKVAPTDDKVAGASLARDRAVAAHCKAPDAREKYQAMSPPEQQKLRATCAKFGVDLGQ